MKRSFKSFTAKRAYRRLGNTCLSFLVALSLMWTQLLLPTHAYASSENDNEEEIVDHGDEQEQENTTVVTNPNRRDRESIGADGEKEHISLEKNEVGDNELLEYMIFSAPMFLSGAILASCHNKWSARVFAGTSAIWLVMEIMQWDNYEEASELSMEAYRYFEDQEKNNEQVEALLEAAEQTDKAAEIAKQKSGNAQLAAAGFGIAAALAIIEGTTDWLDQGPCEGFMTGSLFEDQRDQYYAEVFPASFQGQKQLSTHIQQIQNTQHDSYYANSLAEAQSTSDSIAVFNNWQLQNMNATAQSVHFQGLYRDEYQEFSSPENERQTTQTLKSHFTQIIQGASELVFPSAHAFLGFGGGDDDDEGGDWGKVGWGAIAGVGGFMLGTTEFAQKMMNNAWTRAAFFGGSALGAFMLSSMLDDDYNSLKENAENYRKLADKLHTDTLYQSGLMSYDIPINQHGINGNGLLDKTTTAQSGPCVVERDGKMLRDENCACRKTNSCKSPAIPKPDFKGFDMPGIVSDSIGALRDTEGHLNNGNIEAARTSGQTVSGNANAIRDYNRQIEDHINKDRDKPIDFEANRKAVREGLKNALRRDLRNMPNSAKQTLAGMAPMSSGVNPDQHGSDEVGEDSSTTASRGGATDDLNNRTGSRSSDDKDKDPFAGFSFGSSEDEGYVDPNDFAANMEDIPLEHTGREISSQKDEDIFRIITGRYIRSAYPVIFDRNNNSE